MKTKSRPSRPRTAAKARRPVDVAKSAGKPGVARPVVPLKERRLDFGHRWDYAPAPETSDQLKIAPRHELFIGGKFVAPSTGRHFETINPANE